MCLIPLNETGKHTELAKLPDTFPCWKVIKKSGHCYYDCYDEQPKLARRTHIAQDFPLSRTKIQYALSFHAYLEKPVLDSYDTGTYRIVKCWTKKKDVNCVGFPRDAHTSILAVAVSKITRK